MAEYELVDVAMYDLLRQTAMQSQLIDQGDQVDQLFVQIVRRRVAGDLERVQVAAKY